MRAGLQVIRELEQEEVDPHLEQEVNIQLQNLGALEVVEVLVHRVQMDKYQVQMGETVEGH